VSERVLVIAAHPDDEVLGCGGTMARHVADGDDVNVLFVADGETSRGMKALPNRNLMALAASQIIGTKPPQFLDFSDQRLDQLALLDIVKLIEVHAFMIKPTIVYTHHADDLNLDHRIVHRATMTACRPLPGSSVNAIYAFEVLSSTEWGTGFAPNHFVDVSGQMSIAKMHALECYTSEMRDHPHPRSFEAANHLEKLRGAFCGVDRAEAFMTLRNIRR
jgi:LmbE family N-acetylglucosaminyl deacetylase